MLKNRYVNRKYIEGNKSKGRDLYSVFTLNDVTLGRCCENMNHNLEI